MSLISNINGSFLSKLTTGGKKAAKKDATASSSDFGTPEVEAAVSDIRPGLVRGANAFSSSLDRLNSAIVNISDSRDTLEKVKGSVDRLLKLAQQSSEPGVADEDRADLSLSFKAEILKLRKIVDESDNGDVDLLSTDDIGTILDITKIDRNGTTRLAQTFSNIGGRDGALGTERVTLADNTVVDPMLQNIATEDDAKKAVEAFTELKKQTDRDFEGMDEVFKSLRGAALFARAGAVAFDAAVEYAPNVKDPSQVAQLIVASIRNQTAGDSLTEYSSLDTKLAKDLLVE